MSSLTPESSQPLYLQLAETIRRQIRSGHLKPQDRLQPELDIASQYDVSRGTVRQALDQLVREGLLQRTQGKGTYVRAVNRDRTSLTIGFVVPYLRDTLVNEIIRGAERAFHEENYSMILGHSDSDLDTEVRQVQRLLEGSAEGMILFPVAEQDEQQRLSEIIPPDFPTVLIDRRVPGLNVDRVLVDNRQGARDAVQHLLDQGHERIACITSPDRPSSIVDRIQGYEQAMQEAGHFPLAAVALRGSGSPGDAASNSVPVYSEQELEPVRHLIESDARPTALFCINDFVAIGVMHFLHERGIRVPEDIAIVGFDDIAIAAVSSISLSTVAQPKYEIGRQAAHRLLGLLRGERFPSPEIVLPTELVVRGSTVGKR
jgi:DNA-binding LacI/PurR family transcriptional regulator